MSHEPPEERIRRADPSRSGTRDVTPAVGVRGEPGRYRRAFEGAKVALAKPRWGDARWSYLYGAGDDVGPDQLAGGLGAFFLLTEPPERFGLPAQADSPIQENMPAATAAGVTAAVLAAAGTVVTLVISPRRGKR